jgi:D-glycero-beta-D-manno-heptose-7-phosphate kinase
MQARAEAEALCGALGGRSILVVGDVMLDRYITGSVSRISPEAPVPVVEVHAEHAQPGGAANVAMNIQSLGGRAAVCGRIGDDPAGEELRRLLAARGIATDGLWVDAATRTTVKTRVIAERQQVVRVDREPPRNCGGPDAAARARMEALAAAADGVIVEDYGKGVVTQATADALVRAATACGRPVGYDPKEGHPLRFETLCLATPNLHEACWAAERDARVCLAGDTAERRAALTELAEALWPLWKAEVLLITLGAAGMFLAARAGAEHIMPTRAREVFDVSGAGDTVIAAAFMALLAGASPEAAAELANHAAGLVVGKLGTACCTAEELKEELRDPPRPPPAATPSAFAWTLRRDTPGEGIV